MPRPPLTVVVITRNEEKNIEPCLSSVRDWADEIVVVDDGSSDRTVEIARGFTSRVFERRMDNEGRHRNWAYARATHNWVLSLDADERMTPELREEIDRTLGESSDVFGYNLPRRNFIGTIWLRHGGQYPSAQLRLFRKERFRYEEVGVHPRVFMEGPTRTLKGDILHYSYRDFAHFISKMNGQTSMEARKWAETGRKMTLGAALWRTIDRFFRYYVGKRGYRDGFPGFMLAVFSGLYQIVSYAKFYELVHNPSAHAAGAHKGDEPGSPGARSW